MKLIQTKDYLLLIDEEAKIKPDDYIIHDTVEGVVEANDEWHYRGEKDDYWNKVIAYRKLNENAEELGLPELPNPFDNKTYWVATVIFKDGTKLKSEKFYKYDSGIKSWSSKFSYLMGDEIESISYDRYTESQSKQFSLEGIINFTKWLDKEEIPYEDGSFIKYFNGQDNKVSIEWLFNKYLSSTQQLPKEFIISDMEYLSTDGSWKNVRLPLLDDFARTANLRYKTITNSEGKEELVGTYIH